MTSPKTGVAWHVISVLICLEGLICRRVQRKQRHNQISRLIAAPPPILTSPHCAVLEMGLVLLPTGSLELEEETSS